MAFSDSTHNGHQHSLWKLKGVFRSINPHLVEQQKENAGTDLLGKANYKDTLYYLSFIIKSLDKQHSCGLRIVGSYHIPVLRSPLMSST